MTASLLCKTAIQQIGDFGKTNHVHVERPATETPIQFRVEFTETGAVDNQLNRTEMIKKSR